MTTKYQKYLLSLVDRVKSQGDFVTDKYDTVMKNYGFRAYNQYYVIHHVILIENITYILKECWYKHFNGDYFEDRHSLVYRQRFIVDIRTNKVFIKTRIKWYYRSLKDIQISFENKEENIINSLFKL